MSLQKPNIKVSTCTRPCLRENKTQYAASCAMFAAGYNADRPPAMHNAWPPEKAVFKHG
jgi:hypothetical protein